MGKLRDKITYPYVVSTLALFVALGGTGYAISELERNEVTSKHIKNAGVKNKDLAENAVTSSKVSDGSLLGEDFVAGQLPAGPQGPQGERGAQGEQGLPGEPGRDGVLDVTGRSGYNGSFCIPGREDGVPDPLQCTDTSLTLERPARVHLVAEADWGVYGSAPVAGECQFTVDGGPIPGGPVTQPGELDDADHTWTGDPLIFYLGHTGLTHVTAPLPAGPHSFGLLCGNTNKTIFFENAMISAVAISPN